VGSRARAPDSPQHGREGIVSTPRPVVDDSYVPFIVALWLYAVRLVFSLPPVPQTAAFIPVLEVVVLTIAGGICASAVWEAGRLSVNKIDMTKKNAQERI
jgi:hypothetical protein